VTIAEYRTTRRLLGQREAELEERWQVSGAHAWCWPHDLAPWAERTRRLRTETSALAPAEEGANS